MMTLPNDLAAASDLDTSEAELRRLASSPRPEVRRAVAQNMACPKALLGALFAEFPSDVLQNPASSLFDLEEEGPRAWIPDEVKRIVSLTCYSNEAVLSYLSTDFDDEVRSNVAMNTNDEQILMRLANDSYSNVRWWVATKRSTPEDVLRKLAQDRESFVRLKVAHNPKTPKDVLEELAGDHDQDIARVASERL